MAEIEMGFWIVNALGPHWRGGALAFEVLAWEHDATKRGAASSGNLRDKTPTRI